MSSFNIDLQNSRNLTDCCNTYQKEFIRIQKNQGRVAAVSDKYNLRYKAALRYLQLRPEIIQEYSSVEDVMQLII